MSADSIYEHDVSVLTEHYETLVEHTEKVAFPPIQINFAKWPDLENRPTWQSVLLNIVFPYSPLNDDLSPKGKIIQYLILLLWAMYVQIWLNASRAILINPIPAQPASATPVWLIPILMFFVIPAFLLMPIPYVQLAWFLFSKKNSLVTRLMGILGMVGFVIILSWYGRNYDPTSSMTIHLDERKELYVLFGMVFPAVIFLFWVTAFFVIMVLKLVLNSLTAILRSARPLALEDIREIALEPITSKGKSWLLKDLSLAEIQSLRLWSEQNTEANEKKAVPNLVLMALLALFVSAPFVQTFLNDFIQKSTELLMKVISPQSNATTTEYLAGYFVLIVIVGFASNQVAQFRNFTTQGIIRQACVVAEYAKQQKLTQNSQKQTQAKPFASFLDKFFVFLTALTKIQK